MLETLEQTMFYDLCSKIDEIPIYLRKILLIRKLEEWEGSD
jgi:hypothetical protein